MMRITALPCMLSALWEQLKLKHVMLQIIFIPKTCIEVPIRKMLEKNNKIKAWPLFYDENKFYSVYYFYFLINFTSILQNTLIIIVIAKTNTWFIIVSRRICKQSIQKEKIIVHIQATTCNSLF